MILLGVRPAAAGPVEPERHSVALFHFNLQYCAGGLEGFDEAFGGDFGDYPADDVSVQDQIIRESFLPVLDLLERHPGWAFDLEFQGMFVEALQDRFPEDLERLRALVAAGQVELVSFHYSDQLFVAWPREDLEQSLDRSDAAFAAAGLQASPVVFVQEGQYSPGMAPLMAERGRGVLLLPRNLFGYWHPDLARAQWYEQDGVAVLLAGDGYESVSSPVALRWSYYGDGELMATNELSCYLGPAFAYSETSVARYEDEVAADEEAGHWISTISAYTDALQAAGVPRDPLPPTPDGTWQPDDTDNVARWMGGLGLFVDFESDNEVLTAVAAARARVHAARVFAGQAGITAEPSVQDALQTAATELAIAQVSDATGWSPFETEVAYALDHARQATEAADEVLVAAARALGAQGGATWTLDPRDGTLAAAGIDDDSGWVDVAAGPLKVLAVGTERAVTLAWQQSVEDVRHHRLTVEVGVPEPGSDARDARVTFPLATPDLLWSPALLEDEVWRIPMADLAGGARFTLPLANGLLGLSDQDWLVKDVRTVHLAAAVEPTGAAAVFEDLSIPEGASARWRFHLLQGATEAEAVALARSLNVDGPVEVTLPPDAGDPDVPDDLDEGDGCTCSALRAPGDPPVGGGPWWAVLLAGLAAAGSRRRSRKGARAGSIGARTAHSH